MASIKLNHVYKVYPHSKKEEKKIANNELSPFAVKDFNLDIKDGEFVILVGPSGCGKSTTLRMIAGLEDISAGELYIDDVLANNLDASKRDIAMVFQNYALYPHMTSYQNMSYGLKLRKIEVPVLDEFDKPIYKYDTKKIKELEKKKSKAKTDEDRELIDNQINYLKENKSLPVVKYVHYTKEEIDEKVQKAAEILDIKHLLDRKPSDMSGGQRQRVALGRALVRDPKVFLLDEPLSNLDAKLRASMRNEIVKLHKAVKTTFVYVTHDQIEAMTMGEKIVVMKDGVIQQVGCPSDIYDHPINQFVAGFIGAPQMNFVDIVMKVEAKKVYIVLPNEQEVEIKLENLRPIKEEYSTLGEKELILGLRGEHIYISNEKGVKAEVSLVEILGNTTNILCKMEGMDNDISVTVQERSELKIGDTVYLNFDAKNIHLFDRNTKESIYIDTISKGEEEHE